jgi:hypothetical protein
MSQLCQPRNIILVIMTLNRDLLTEKKMKRETLGVCFSRDVYCPLCVCVSKIIESVCMWCTISNFKRDGLFRTVSSISPFDLIEIVSCLLN